MKKLIAIYAIASVLMSSHAEIVFHPAMELEIPTEPNKYYQVQVSSDLENWTDYGQEIVGTGESVFQLVSTQGGTQAFYRYEVYETNRQVTIDIASYANLCGRWDYRRTPEEGGAITSWAVQVMGTTNEQGQPVYLLQEYDENGYPNDQFFLLTDLSEALLELGGLNDYGQPSESRFYWDPPVPRLMRAFVPGKEYIMILTRSDMPGMSLEGRMRTEPETVTVPYGTFDCYKVTRSFWVDGAEVYVETTWHAQHVGLIKRDQNGGDLWELNTYEP